MHTTMNVTGRPAQFGRGVMVEVGGKLVEQFAQNLRQLITDGSAAAPDAPAEAGAEAAGPPRRRDRPRRRRIRGGRGPGSALSRRR